MSPRGSVIPMRGHAPPELAPPGDGAARHGSRPPSLDKRTRRPGESGILTHNIDAKLADIASTAARIARPVQAGRPWAQCGNIDPRVAPSGRAVGKYFLACPCLRAVAVIGWGRIAVPSVSAV